MPPDAFEEHTAAMPNWGANTLLPNNPTHDHWFPTQSAVDPNLITHPSSHYEFQPQFISASNVNPLVDTAAISPHDPYTYNQTPKLDFDLHQGQHWSGISSPPQHALPIPNATLSSGASGGATQFPADESPRNSIASVTKLPGQANLRKAPARDSSKRSISAATSPSKSATSVPKSHGLESTKLQQVNRQQRDVPSSKSQSNNGSAIGSPNAAQRGLDRKKHTPIPKGTALNQMFSVDVAKAREDDESRTNRFGTSARGDSTVSSTSGQSRSENPQSRSEVQDDDFTSTMSRSEKKGAGMLTPGVLRSRPGFESEDGQQALPHTKGFSIQIGSEVFKLSGASIMSDG